MKIFKNKGIIQIIKFGLVGVINTCVSQFVYMISVFTMYNAFHMSETDQKVYFISNIIAFVISVFTAFLISNKFVFVEDKDAQKRVWWKTLIKTYMAYAFTGLILSNLLSTFWMDVVHIYRYLGWLNDVFAWIGIEMSQRRMTTYIAPLFNMVISIPINFIMNKYWAYRQKGKKKV